MFWRRAGRPCRPAILAVFVLAVAGTGASGCSEPPTKERNQADGALAAARAADAATYAPDELHAAEAALQKYDAAVAAHDYRQALNLALEARDGASDAAKRASDEKAVARSQAERLVVDIDTLSRTAAARLAGTAAPRVTGAAADRLRAVTRPVPAALQEARTGIDAQRYRAVVVALTPIYEDLRRELEPPPAPPRRGR